MKKLLSILSICLVVVSCSPDRVIVDELTQKGTYQKPTMYFEGALFNGVGFDVYEDGQLFYERNYKDGELDGLSKTWHLNGQLQSEVNWKDGALIYIKGWNENGQIIN